MMFSEQLETVQASNYYVAMVVKSYIANIPKSSQKPVLSVLVLSTQ